MGTKIIITEADFSSVDINSVNLNSIAFDGKSYRQIFETLNLFPITPGFEDGTSGSLITPSNASSPEITSAVADSGTYCLKAFGNPSHQWQVSSPLFYTSDTLLIGCRVKCTRWSAGKLGVILGSTAIAIQSTNTDFETKTGTATGTAAGSGLFVGSAISANLDGYIDTPVAVKTSSFSTVPTLTKWTELYNTYVTIKKGE